MSFVSIQQDPDGIQWVWKDDQSRLDYLWDWAAKEHGTWPENWLQPGEIITTYQIAVPTGLTLDDDYLTQDNKSVIAVFTGGGTGGPYDVVNSITTNNGREACWTMRVKMRSVCGANP